MRRLHAPCRAGWQLRSASPLAEDANLTVPANTSVPVGNVAAAGNASELSVRFALPPVACRFGVRVLLQPGQPVGVELYVEYQPPAAANQSLHRVTVGSAPCGGAATHAAPWRSPQTSWPPQPFPTDTLALLPSDRSIELRVFIDAAAATVESFWMDGRVTLTTVAPAGDATRGAMELFSDTAGVLVLEAVAWGMGDIWVPPEALMGGAA